MVGTGQQQGPWYPWDAPRSVEERVEVTCAGSDQRTLASDFSGLTLDVLRIVRCGFGSVLPRAWGFALPPGN